MTDKLGAGLPGRMHWLDNLRTFMVFLVVVLHSGLVYESSGIAASFWIVDDPSTNDWSGLVNLILDIFVMPTIFFISGFLTPPSLDRRTGWGFLVSKFRRLMVPWLIAVLTLIPIYKVIFLYSRNLAQESWLTYFHWSNGIWGQNWLWFLPVLFLFDVLYLFLSRLKLDTSGITLKRIIPAIILVSFVYSFAFDLCGAQGWTKTILLDFQNERLLIYFLMFFAGALFYKLEVFPSSGRSRRLYIAAGCTAWIPINIYLFLVIYPLLNQGRHVVSPIFDAMVLRMSFLLSLLCLLYLSVETFRRYLDRQGRVSKELGRNSYDVYIIHIVVMGAIAVTLLNVAIPSLVKHLVLAVLTYLASTAIIYTYRRVHRQIVSNQRLTATNGTTADMLHRTG